MNVFGILSNNFSKIYFSTRKKKHLRVVKQEPEQEEKKIVMKTKWNDRRNLFLTIFKQLLTLRPFSQQTFSKSIFPSLSLFLSLSVRICLSFFLLLLYVESFSFAQFKVFELKINEPKIYEKQTKFNCSWRTVGQNQVEK